MKNSSDTIGNRTRDLPTCSAVPKPIAPPSAPETCRRGRNYEVCANVDFVNEAQIYLRSSHVMPARSNTNL